MTIPKVEITIPVFNEEKELEENIKKLSNFCFKHLNKYNWHITIADNASSDTTLDVAKNLANNNQRISFVRLDKKGRGRAVKEVWKSSNADFCVYMDLDLSTDLKHLPQMLTKLQQGYDIVVGSRLAKGAKVEGRTILREIMSRCLNFLFIKLFFHTHFTDAQCGFKGVTKDVVKNLLPYIKDNQWFFDGELLIVGEKSGYKIYDMPVHWVDNPGSTVRLLSTIMNDIEAMWRLFRTKPWKYIKAQ